MTTKTRKTLEWALILGGFAGAVAGFAGADNYSSRANDSYLKAREHATSFNYFPRELQQSIIHDNKYSSILGSLATLSALTAIGAGGSVAIRKFG